MRISDWSSDVCSSDLTIEACRIEALRPIRAGIVTARALAPVADLLHYARAFADASTLYLLLKGERVEDELTTAKQRWNMRIDRIPSLSDTRGVIHRLEGVADVLLGFHACSGAANSGHRQPAGGGTGKRGGLGKR